MHDDKTLIARLHADDLLLGDGKTCGRCSLLLRGLAWDARGFLCHPSCSCHADCYTLVTAPWA
ncbi:hypothetical protein [Ornithinimicrobium sp. LYQ103]|uniref:hypothetical protein n=1 Tax=Ornithinimicrobium sp. LYQ103 TaxID=3378796 RepID=UPI003853C852